MGVAGGGLEVQEEEAIKERKVSVKEVEDTIPHLWFFADIFFFLSPPQFDLLLIKHSFSDGDGFQHVRLGSARAATVFKPALRSRQMCKCNTCTHTQKRKTSFTKLLPAEPRPPSGRDSGPPLKNY